MSGDRLKCRNCNGTGHIRPVGCKEQRCGLCGGTGEKQFASVADEMRAEVREVLFQQDEHLSQVRKHLEAIDRLRCRLSRVETWFAAQETSADVR